MNQEKIVENAISDLLYSYIVFEVRLVGYIQMRKSRQGLQPALSQKIDSKLLFFSKHTSTHSGQGIAKMDFVRQEEYLQREYNLKFMTDRKRMSTQKSQKSLSSSKLTHKDYKPKQQPTPNQILTPTHTPIIQPQRLDFDSLDFRTKYYQLHDEYINERRKNIEKSEESLTLREALGGFLSCFDSKSAEELCRLLEGEKLKEIVKKAVEGRRKAEAGEGVLKEAMRILQVDSWEELVHNLRARVERFRSLDECTFKILQLEAINKRVVNDFEERLQRIREDQEEEWAREKQMMAEELKNLQRVKQASERDKESLRMQLQTVLSDITVLASSESGSGYHLQSGRSQVGQLERVLGWLRGRVQEIEVQAQQNMLKLLKSNEEMMKLQRSISQLRGELQLQMEELEEKNQQNLCEINHLQAQLDQQKHQMQLERKETARREEERQKAAQQEQDERTLIASALSLTDPHPTKLLLAIKRLQEHSETLQQQNTQLKTAIEEKDNALGELQGQTGRWMKAVKEAQQMAKEAVSDKEQFKFLLNNLRDQSAEVKRQHQEELARTIQRKDEEIINSNRDILQSHAALTDQLALIRAEHTTLILENKEAKAALAHTRSRAEQAQRQLIEQQGVIKRLTVEGERFKRELRQIEGSFREVVELEEVTSKRAIALEIEKGETARACASLSSRTAELTKNNQELTRQRNQLKTQLSVARNDLKDLKELKSKLEATTLDLRMDNLNRQAEITKLEEKLKQSEADIRVLKSSNDKFSSELNTVTRKLIGARSEIKRKVISKLKEALLATRSLRNDNNNLKEQMRLEISENVTNFSQILLDCVEEVGNMKKNYAETVDYECQSDIYLPVEQISIIHQESQCTLITQDQESQYEIPTAEYASQVTCPTEDNQSQCTLLASDLQERVLSQLTRTLTALSLLRSQQHEILQAVQPLQSFSLQEVFRVVYEDSQSARLRALQGSIEMIKEESLQEGESQLRDVAKIITPDEILAPESDGHDANIILQALLEDDEIPSLPYWEKIQTNFLAVRRRISRRSLKLDISSIDFKDPSYNSPRYSYNQTEIIRRITTDPDDPFDHPTSRDRDNRETITNRSERFSPIDSLRRENEELKSFLEQARKRADEAEYRLEEREGEVNEMKGKLVRLENEISIVGLSHNFKKVVDYILNDNADLFLQTCRILMKMLHFQEKEIKEFQEQLLNKRKKKKSGLFGGIFKT